MVLPVPLPVMQSLGHRVDQIDTKTNLRNVIPIPSFRIESDKHPVIPNRTPSDPSMPALNHSTLLRSTFLALLEELACPHSDPCRLRRAWQIVVLILPLGSTSPLTTLGALRGVRVYSLILLSIRSLRVCVFSISNHSLSDGRDRPRQCPDFASVIAPSSQPTKQQFSSTTARRPYDPTLHLHSLSSPHSNRITVSALWS